MILSGNQGAERLFGFTSEEAIGRPVTIIIPQDRLDEEPTFLEKIHRGERIEHFETVRQRKDGSFVDISLTVSPIRKSRGKIVGASKIARDITELNKAREQQRLLLREMSDRVKNLFALSGSIVGLSARSAKSPHELAELTRARLSALARATLSLSRTASVMLRASRRRSSRSSAPSWRRLTNRNTRALRSPELTLAFLVPPSPASLCCCMNSRPTRPNTAPSHRQGIGKGRLCRRRRRDLVHWTEHGGPPVAAPNGGLGLARCCRESRFLTSSAAKSFATGGLPACDPVVRPPIAPRNLGPDAGR